jgi:16S rRNA processing protein RimM
MSEPALPADWLILGKVVGVYGVQGWIKIESYTRPRDAIFKYGSWQIGTDQGWQALTVDTGRPQGPGLVAKLQEIPDRDQARTLIGAAIAVARDQLPPAAKGEVYWADLEGCTVVNRAGIELGKVDHLLETGANDVLVVQRIDDGGGERLIPYIVDVIDKVDLESKMIRVDWDENF